MPRMFIAVVACYVAAAVSWVRAESKPINITDALAVRATAGRGGGRTLISADAIAGMLAKGEFATPRAGDKLNLPGGAQPAIWRAVKANKDGVFQDGAMGGSYVFCAV